MFLHLWFCVCVQKCVLGSRDSSPFSKDSCLVSVWQWSSYSHLQTKFSFATGLRSTKPRVQLKLVRLRDTTKWNVPLSVLLTMVHFNPLQCLHATFPFYTLHTSITIFCLFLWVYLCPCRGTRGSCCAAFTRIALPHGRMGLEIRWALITGAKAGYFTLQLAEYTSVSGSQEYMAT